MSGLSLWASAATKCPAKDEPEGEVAQDGNAEAEEREGRSERPIPPPRVATIDEEHQWP